MTSDRVNLSPRYFRDDVIVYYVIISTMRSPPRSPSSRHRRTRFTIRRIRTREFRLMIQREAVRVQSRRASNERDVSGITIPINYVNTSGRRELHSITASPAARGFRASSRLIAGEAVREIYIYIYFFFLLSAPPPFIPFRVLPRAIACRGNSAASRELSPRAAVLNCRAIRSALRNCGDPSQIQFSKHPPLPESGSFGRPRSDPVYARARVRHSRPRRWRGDERTRDHTCPRENAVVVDCRMST